MGARDFHFGSKLGVHEGNLSIKNGWEICMLDFC